MSEIPPTEPPSEPQHAGSATPEPATAEQPPIDSPESRPVDAGATSPPMPPPWQPVTSSPPPPAGGRLNRTLRARSTGWIVAGLLAGALLGLSVADATTNSPRAIAAPSGRGFTPQPGGLGALGGTARGRATYGNGTPFGNRAAGASIGTVKSVGSNSFAMTTSSGTAVTVKETSSTTYRSGFNASASASAVKVGDRVFVSGATSGTTITATQVIVVPSGGFGGFRGPAAS